MKRLYSYFLIFTFVSTLMSCSLNGHDINNSSNDLMAYFKKRNIRPSDPTEITDAYVIYKDGFKIAIGQKNGNAWLAKFNADGTQVYTKEFSFQYKNIFHSFFKKGSIVEPDDKENEYDHANVLFLYARMADDDKFDPNPATKDKVCEPRSLLAVNLDNGAELYRSEIAEQKDYGYFWGTKYEYVYTVYPSNNSYIIESLHYTGDDTTYDKFISVSQAGVNWQRDTNEDEYICGLISYTHYVLLDQNNLLYPFYNWYHIVDLKDQKVRLEFSIPAKGIHQGPNFSVSSQNKLTVNHDKARIFYNEYETITRRNEITGEMETKTVLVDQFYYQVDINTYQVSGPIQFEGDKK